MAAGRIYGLFDLKTIKMVAIDEFDDVSTSKMVQNYLLRNCKAQFVMFSTTVNTGCFSGVDFNCNLMIPREEQLSANVLHKYVSCGTANQKLAVLKTICETNFGVSRRIVIFCDVSDTIYRLHRLYNTRLLLN